MKHGRADPLPCVRWFVPNREAVEMTAITLSPREMKRRRKQGADYVPPSPYTVKAALTKGDVFTRLSAIVFGLGNIVRKQYVKGIAMLALEVAFFVYPVSYTHLLTSMSMRRKAHSWPAPAYQLSASTV